MNEAIVNAKSIPIAPNKDIFAFFKEVSLWNAIAKEYMKKAIEKMKISIKHIGENKTIFIINDFKK